MEIVEIFRAKNMYLEYSLKFHQDALSIKFAMVTGSLLGDESPLRYSFVERILRMFSRIKYIFL